MVNVRTVNNAMHLHENVVQNYIAIGLKLIKLEYLVHIKVYIKGILKRTDDVILKIVTVLALLQQSLVLTVM